MIHEQTIFYGTHLTPIFYLILNNGIGKWVKKGLTNFFFICNQNVEKLRSLQAVGLCTLPVKNKPFNYVDSLK